MSAAYNPKHPYLIHDQNGFAIASATRKPTALKRAREAAERGLDMQVSCPHNRIIWCRTKDRALIQRRYHTTNGWTLIGSKTYA